MKKEQSNVKCRWMNCDRIYDSQRKCLNHLRLDHNLKGTQGKCYWGRCEFVSSNYGIRNHVKRHFDLIEAYCTICEETVCFKWRFDLNKHLKQFHDSMSFDMESVDMDGFSVFIAKQKQLLPMTESLAKILN